MQLEVVLVIVFGVTATALGIVTMWQNRRGPQQGKSLLFSAGWKVGPLTSRIDRAGDETPCPRYGDSCIVYSDGVYVQVLVLIDLPVV